ncbi:hypothetical protein LCGC14_1887110 [marine sediment metagenome]|uniref:Uncharacterized protein n=1 Tax=marine sediment metagenome TaxID=412755 RepID=A0A0F9IED8_9ZZZZ
MTDGDHQLEERQLNRFVDLLLINTWFTAAGAIAGWVALLLMLAVVLR